MSLEIRKATLADWPLLIPFYIACWDKDSFHLDKTHWEWQFFNNPLLKENESSLWIVIKDNKVIAQIGTVPAILQINGKMYRINWLIHIMSHPDFRGAGTGVFLFKAISEKDRNIAGLGISDEALPLYQFFCKDMHDVFWWSKILRLDHTLKKRLKSKLIGNCISFVVNTFFRIYIKTGSAKNNNRIILEEVRDISNELIKAIENSMAGKSLVIKNKDFLNWKYLGQPFTKTNLVCFKENGHIIGGAVLRIIQHRGRIVELWVKSDKYDAAIDIIISYFDNKKVNRIDQLTNDDELISILKSKGFFNTKSSVRFYLDKILLKENGINNQILISSGDSDLERPEQNLSNYYN